jgi:hypothetical protein
MSNISNWFFRLAIAYLLTGVTLGIIMGASGDHSMFPLHAHLNLLGWVTMMIFAFFYRAFPAAAASKLAKVHFWIYVPAHFVQMVLLAFVLRGNAAMEPLLGIASMVVAAAIVCFAVILWKQTGAAQSAGGMADAMTAKAG